MTATGPGPGEVSNQVDNGVFFSAVIQGRDIQVVLPAEVRPALTGGLPRISSVFTGRDKDMQPLLDRLRPDQPGKKQVVSAVAGLPGVGKTELVLHAAHQAVRDGWFPGGVLYFNLYGYDPERRQTAADALAAWLSATGIPGEHIPATEQDRSRLWRSVLDAYTAQGHRLLLIIDNASNEAQVTPLLPGDHQVPVLVTSRHTLDLDAVLYDLDILDPDPARDLIVEVLTSRRGPGDPRLLPECQEALGELAGLCAGLPLALEIVAALLADRVQYRPDVLADRLGSEQDRLDGLTREEAAVRTAFDLSYQHLTTEQARLFRLLPVNPGPDIATATVAQLADLPEHRCAALLGDLYRAHLITEPAPERWAMHDLVRLYAGDQHNPDDTDETARARARLYDYYRQTTRAADTTGRLDRDLAR